MININDEDNEVINEEEQIKEEETNETVSEEKENDNDNDNEELSEEELNDIASKVLEDKEKELKDANDKYLRLYAEYDNFRKRTQVEKCDMYDKGIIETVQSFLDVIDNFDRALSNVNKEELDDKSKNLVDGIEMIRGQMDKALNKIGVTAIDAKGNEFDPNIHNAVMHVDDESLGENVVAEELQRGYMYNDKVVRHSMVKVAN